MALQNIGAGNSHDPFYRYKMPKMKTKIEIHGNWIKTNIVNMVDIAKALARPASYITKYFECALCVQSMFDKKTGVSLVSGAYDTRKLAGLLNNFIEKYVQCYLCGNPETEVLITKTRIVQLKCLACGFLSDVDMRDKLTSFILQNPPEQNKSLKDKKAGVTKKKANGSDKDRTSPTRSHVDDKEDDDDGVQWQTDTSAEAAQKRIQEQLSAVMVMLTTDEPEKKPKTDLKKGENGNYGNLNSHAKLIEKMKEELNKGVAYKELIRDLTVSDQEVMNALYEALFDGIEKGFAKQVVNKKKYLVSAAAESDGSQLVLLRAMEKFCGKSNNTNALKEIALVLEAMYDADVLDEEYVVKWFEEGLAGDNKNSAIWKYAKPFVEWLQSAESETEEE